jgi:hypothetical protein
VKTLASILDEIWTSHGSAEPVAKHAAQTLTPELLVELFVFVANAHGKGWLKAERATDDRILFSMSPRGATEWALITSRKSSRPLIILRDPNLCLVSEGPALAKVWGSSIRFETSQLLQALQYARDVADDELYRPHGQRGQIADAAARFGIDSKLMRAFAANANLLRFPGPSLAA